MRKFNTLVEFLGSKSLNPSMNDIVDFLGYSEKGIGGASWEFKGTTGQTPSQSPAQLGDALLNDGNGNQWELVVNKNVNLAALGADITGVVGMAAVLSAALNSKKGPVTGPDGFYNLDAPVFMPKGTSIFSENGVANVFLNNDDTPLYDGGMVFLVTHGAGINDSNLATYFANTAITLEQGCVIKGVTFNYPNQDLGQLTPVAYPPALSVAYRARGATITDVNLGNAYVGIDALRDHSNLYIDRIVGFPLWRGIRGGSMVDNDYLDHVHFSPLRVLYSPQGESFISPNVTEWVTNNGIVLELNRVTWSIYENIFGIEYSVGIFLTNRLSDPANGINVGGSPQNITISKCGFDSCPIGIKGDGFQGRLKIVNNNFTPLNIFDAAATGNYAVLLENQSGTITNVLLDGNDVWATPESAFKLVKQNGSKIVNNTIHQVGGEVQGTGILLDNCLDSTVRGNTIDCNGTVNLSVGVDLINNCEGSIVDGNTIKNFDSYPLRIDQTDETSIVINRFKNNLLTGITDASASKKYANNIKGNISDSYPNYDNADVDVNGLLSNELGFNLIRYSGTAGIKGITHGNIDEVKTIRFSAVCTVSDTDGTVPQENRLYLSGNFVSAFGSTLTLISAGNLGWYEVSRSVN